MTTTVPVCFSGDVLFAGSGSADRPAGGGDHDQLLESIEKKLLPLPDETRCYPATDPRPPSAANAPPTRSSSGSGPRRRDDSDRERRVSGTTRYPDFPPASADFRRVRDTLADAARRAGYGHIELPIFEDTGLFARGVGESTDVVEQGRCTPSPTGANVR